MKNRLTIDKRQLTGANQILNGLRQAISPEFLGLVSTSGQPITIYSSPTMVDTDAIGSLAAGSYAATRLLARMMNGDEFTVMFHEGSDLNVHIAQVSDQILLVVCFRKTEDIGRVRLLSRKAAAALHEVMDIEGEKSGTD